MILSLFMSFALAQTIQGIRPDILNSSDDYLNARITKEQFYQSLEKWNQMGWSEEEKNLVIDTIQKSFDSSKEKNRPSFTAHGLGFKGVVGLIHLKKSSRKNGLTNEV